MLDTFFWLNSLFKNVKTVQMRNTTSCERKLISQGFKMHSNNWLKINMFDILKRIINLDCFLGKIIIFKQLSQILEFHSLYFSLSRLGWL